MSVPRYVLVIVLPLVFFFFPWASSTLTSRFCLCSNLRVAILPSPLFHARSLLASPWELELSHSLLCVVIMPASGGPLVSMPSCTTSSLTSDVLFEYEPSDSHLLRFLPVPCLVFILKLLAPRRDFFKGWFLGPCTVYFLFGLLGPFPVGFCFVFAFFSLFNFCLGVVHSGNED